MERAGIILLLGESLLGDLGVFRLGLADDIFVLHDTAFRLDVDSRPDADHLKLGVVDVLDDGVFELDGMVDASSSCQSEQWDGRR